MKYTHLIITGAIFLLTVIVGTALLFKEPQAAGAAGFQMTNIGYVATSSALVTVPGSSVRIAATTTSPTAPDGSFERIFATMCSTSTVPVILNLDGDKPANSNNGYTAIIAAAAGYSACYELNDQRQYFGSITASSTGAPVSVSVKQYVR